MKHEEWKRKEKIIRTVTKALLLTNTWQAHHSSFFHSDWSDSPDYENKDTENVTAQKKQKTSHGRIMADIQSPRKYLQSFETVIQHEMPASTSLDDSTQLFYPV